MIITYFLIFLISLSLITILIIGGAIASRKWHFNFTYISFISTSIYFGTSYCATSLISPIAGITMVGLIGLYEATLGLKLIQQFKANLGEMEEEFKYFLDENNHPSPNFVVLMVLIYLFIGWFGTLFV